MSRKRASDRVAAARSLTSAQDAEALYRDWAEDYDRDVAGELRFIGGDRIAALLADHLADRSARILDLGCGTGLVGEALKAHGFANVDGLDLSPDMLAVADRKAVYVKTVQANLLQPLDVPDGVYDAAISAGTFTTGHVDASALPEVLRVTRRGGLLACVVADAVWRDGGFAAAFAPHARHILHHTQEQITENGGAAGHYLIVRVPACE